MINICYSGSLDGFDPKRSKYRTHDSFKDWVWSFNNNNVNPSTRSGYYLIKAVAALKKEGRISPSQLHIHLWGNISEININQIKTEYVEEYFTVLKYLPKNLSIEKLSKADVLFLPLEKANSSVHRTLFIPGKLFEYLAMKKPILALCEQSDCREIVERSGLGICVQPDDIDQIKEMLYEMLNNKNILLARLPDTEYIRKFSFREKTSELASIFDEILTTR